MDKDGRPALTGDARWRVIETRIEKRPRGCGDQAERPLGIAVVDRRDMVGKRRQSCIFRSDRRPIGAEMKLLVGLREAVEKMPGRKRRAAIESAVCREALDTR